MADVAQPDPLEIYLVAVNCRRKATAANTITAYESDFRAFAAYCAGRRLCSMPAPPSTTAYYAAELAKTLKANTIARRLTAIAWAHQRIGYLSPTKDPLVRKVMAGIRRVKRTPRQSKKPLTPALLREMFATAPDDLRMCRDRALLLVGCTGRFWRSELLALRHQDIRFTEAGLVVTIPKSKTDGQERMLEIPYGSDVEICPVQALAAWLERSHITSGYLFPAIGRWRGEVSGKPVCGHQLAKIIKRLAARASLNPKAFSVSSLRSSRSLGS
jgi:site-specific recombinase XerD